MGMALFSKEILQLFTTPPYYSAWAIIPVLAMASMLSKLYIFAPGLDIEKKTKTIAMNNIVSAIMNILLNILLIPLLGILGSALATLISATLLFLPICARARNSIPSPTLGKR